MNTVIIARYGEIHLKGQNRGYFLSALTKNLRASLGSLCKVELEHSRFVFSGFKTAQGTTILDTITKTFGIVSASLCTCVKHSEILKHLKTIPVTGTFKTNVNRADKTFPHTSQEFAAIAGGVVLDANPSATVDVINPATIVYIDIRAQDQAYVYTNIAPGVGGMPTGTAGRAIVMLSGGIDSPVAAFLAAKRGLDVDFVHFASPPFTSEHALDKVKRLATALAPYTGKTRLFVVNFTDIQQAIRKNCDPCYLITLMRRFMVRIASTLSLKHGCQAIITGESLAQVASQTIHGIATNNVCAGEIPILRPLVTYDKSEIIDLAKRIGTYEISIEPHQDCCTVFVPDKPVIKPTLARCEREETKLDIDNLVNTAVAETAC